jgi:hypothetical protein
MLYLTHMKKLLCISLGLSLFWGKAALAQQPAASQATTGKDAVAVLNLATSGNTYYVTIARGTGHTEELEFRGGKGDNSATAQLQGVLSKLYAEGYVLQSVSSGPSLVRWTTAKGTLMIFAKPR